VLMLFITIFDVLWLCAVLALLILIWRSSERRLKQGAVMEAALVDVAQKDAESARLAVTALQELVHVLKLNDTIAP
jgi:hypothetical protein